MGHWDTWDTAMKHEDLAPFAVADGLLAKIATEPAGQLTDVEHQCLLDRARENLAKATGETVENAGRAMHQAANEGEFTLQAGNEFACVTIYGRLLVVMTRWELRGTCHPATN
jgi:hypothetical protein